MQQGRATERSGSKSDLSQLTGTKSDKMEVDGKPKRNIQFLTNTRAVNVSSIYEYVCSERRR